MNPRRLLTTLLAILASVLLLAGCGGSGGGASGPSEAVTGAVPDSARLAPADATAFVTVNTDTASQAWSDADRLVDLVPGARKALNGAIDGMLRGGVSWTDDVKPMLGAELVVVVTKDNQPLVLMKPTDAAGFEKLFREQSATTVFAERDGWKIAAGKQSVIDGYEAALSAGTLASLPRFRTSIEALPADAMARAYVSGANLMSSVRDQLASMTTGRDKLSLEAMSMAVVPGKDGVLMTATVKTPAGGNGTTYEPRLLGRVPADAVAALSFGGTQSTVDKVRGTLGLDEISKTLEDVAGVSLDGIIGMFSGEGLLYLRAGTTIPEVTLVLAPPDVDRAFSDVDTMVRKLAKGMDVPVKTIEQDGLTVQKVDAGTVNVSYARLDDAVIVTTGASGIRLFLEDGDKLDTSAAFRRAADKVGLGDRTAGFFYVDVDGLIPLAEGLADAADTQVPDEVRKAMNAFDSVILTGASVGDGTTTMSGFVAMRG